jgi:glycosyltransferase involved in cell wall biosynthesis
VIVRAKDRERTIGQALRSLRRQTIVPEIIVVDSGSSDGTVSIARSLCDRLIEIPADSFTYGHALNVGAAAARAPIHFALSAHCEADSEDWIERSLAHYANSDVAGTCGYSGALPDGAAPGVVHQDLELLRRDPFWGFTNHASSWRADVWRRFPFDESLAAAEDKEWSWRVLGAGYVIALDPELDVSTRHRFDEGLTKFYRRTRRDTRALAGFSGLSPYPRAALMSEWWSPEPDGLRSAARLRLSPWRMASLLGRQAGLRQAAHRRP